MSILLSGGYVDLPGTTGNYLFTPDAAALDIVGDLCIVALIAPDDWTPAGTGVITGKWSSAGTTVSYLFQLTTTGTLQFFWSVDGTSALGGTSTVNLSALSNGAWKWGAVTFDVDNGAAGRSIRFWTSDDGIAWTQLGATVTTAGVTSIHAGTAPLEIGTQAHGTSSPFAGNIAHVSIRNGIGAGGTVGGTEVFRFNAENDLYGINPAVTSFIASTGQTVTVNRSGTPATTLVPPLYTSSPAIGTLSIHAFDLVTGEAFGTLDVGQVKWSERLNGRMELSFRLDLAHQPSAELAPSLVDDTAVRPVKLVLYDPPIAKSFMLLEASYTERRFLNCRAAGLWSWFAQFPLSDPFTFAQTDQHTIAATLLNWAQQGGGIGVAVDNTLSGVLRDRTYNGFEYVPVGQRVDEVAAVIDGFDFAIDTTFDGNVTVVDTWRPQYPRAGRSWPDSGIQIDADGTAVALTADMSLPTTDMLAIGAGEGTDMLTATAHDATHSEYPALWTIGERRKSVERLDTLQEHADRDLQLANRRTRRWAVTVLDRYGLLKGLIVGDECQIAIGPGDRRWPDGLEVVQRVVGRAVNVEDDGGPDRVTLELENIDV